MLDAPGLLKERFSRQTSCLPPVIEGRRFLMTVLGMETRVARRWRICGTPGDFRPLYNPRHLKHLSQNNIWTLKAWLQLEVQRALHARPAHITAALQHASMYAYKARHLLKALLTERPT